MGENTSIEWTDASWSPIRARWIAPKNDGGGRERVGWHCEHVSEGCRNCYAEGINLRLGTGLPFKPDHLRREIRVPPGDRNGSRELRGDVTVFLDEKMLLRPLHWRRPRKIFVGSMTDLFADFVPDSMLDRIFGLMALAHWHTFQLLTKRPARMRAYIATWFERLAEIDPLFSHPAGAARFSKLVDWAVLPTVLPNVWLGTSCEDQATADARIPDLLATPAAVRFVSAEPLLGPIDFLPWLDPTGACCGGIDDGPRCEGCPSGAAWRYSEPCDEQGCRDPNLDWLIVGGESGPRARPMHPRWATNIRDQCAAAGVSFLFKQHGAFRPIGPIHHHDDAYSDAIISADARRSVIICRDGSLWPDDAGQPPSDAWMVERVGKRAAGRLLGGREHNGMPEVRHG